MSQICIRTNVSGSPYFVVVDTGARNLLASTIKEVMGSLPEKVAVVTNPEIGIEVDPGLKNQTFYLEPGESSKNLSAIEKLCGEFSDYGLTRGDLIVAIGGGQISDMVGFAAATYHRGLPVIFIPTTLLAQVDAAIGGKNGVNLTQGKNLVGTFHQPVCVLCDIEALQTLPEQEYLSGLGEVAKYHFIADYLMTIGLKDYFEELNLELLNPESDIHKWDIYNWDASHQSQLVKKIAYCIGVKLFVVTKDEKDIGLRSILNYGHTLGHALEVAGKFDISHGEAVSIGVVFAGELAHILGRIDDKRALYHRDLVASYGLPTSLADKNLTIPDEELLDLMSRDKKARGKITFVLEGPDGMEPAVQVPKQAIVEALARIRE